LINPYALGLTSIDLLHKIKIVDRSVKKKKANHYVLYITIKGNLYNRGQNSAGC